MRKIFLTSIILLLFDQALKFWVKTNMFLGQEYPIFDWFIIHFTENNGMAFGMEFGLLDRSRANGGVDQMGVAK